MSCCGGGGDGGAEAARQAEIDRQNRIKQSTAAIDQQFLGFDDAFYDAKAKAYQRFALPQLASQNQDMTKQLTYKLAQQGLLNSSGARTLSDSLNKATTAQRQGIVDESLNQANQLRRDVANEKANLYSQAQVAADPAQATRLAISSAANMQLPSTFAPVTNLLAGWANSYLADKVAQTYGQGRIPSATSSFASTPTTLRY